MAGSKRGALLLTCHIVQANRDLQTCLLKEGTMDRSIAVLEHVKLTCLFCLALLSVIYPWKQKEKDVHEHFCRFIYLDSLTILTNKYINIYLTFIVNHFYITCTQYSIIKMPISDIREKEKISFFLVAFTCIRGRLGTLFYVLISQSILWFLYFPLLQEY